MEPKHLLTMYANVPKQHQGSFSALLFSNPCWKLLDAPCVDATLRKVTIDVDNVSVVFTILKEALNLIPEESDAEFLSRMHTLVVEEGLNIQSMITPQLDPSKKGITMITDIN